MENKIMSRYFSVAFAGLSCGIIGLLTGGFGNDLFDRILFFIMFCAVAFICFYLLKLGSRKYFFKIAVLSSFVMFYAALISLWLLTGSVVIGVILINKLPQKNVTPPDIASDSPLSYGLKNIPPWKIAVMLFYGLVALTV